MIICSKHTVPGQVGFVMKKKFCHETFLTSSRGILIARNFSKEKKNILMWGNGAISASESLHLIFLTYLHEMQVW